jgi:predicted molibdopterin-dependent oxidoreductase YjgC
MRIIEHPILPDDEKKPVTIYYNGKPLEAMEGEPVAAALMAAGIRSMRTTAKLHEPRGIFCAIGRCTDCMMVVDGVPNTRTCVTYVYDGMRVERQDGLGAFGSPDSGGKGGSR